MTTSDQINELAAALTKAQAEMKGATKDSENPHFRSRYADLASVREACWPALTKHGLSVVQSPRLVGSDAGWIVEVETRMLHTSGQFIADVAATPLSKPDAQGVGSATTYLRRYALAAFAGIAPEDDDGNAASTPRSNGHAAKSAPPAGAGDCLTTTVSDVRMKKGTSKSGKPFTKYIIQTHDGEFSTFDQAAAESAKAVKGTYQAVEIDFMVGAYGNDLVGLRVLPGLAEDAPAEPVL